MPCSPESTPPTVDARPQDRVAGVVDPLPDARLAGVEHDQRVQVAVAGVEDVHHREPLLAGDRVDLAQHVDELRARHDRVVQVVVGRDAGDRAERRLAALPEQRPLRLVGRDPHRARAVGEPDRRGSASTCACDAAVEPVELDEQHGGGVARVARADEVLDRAGDLGVHHLERGGHDPGGDDPADGRGRVVDRDEVEEQRPDHRWVRA